MEEHTVSPYTRLIPRPATYLDRKVLFSPADLKVGGEFSLELTHLSSIARTRRVRMLREDSQPLSHDETDLVWTVLLAHEI